MSIRAVRHLAATLIVALASGCATAVDVSFDPSEDFSSFRTWDWLPGARSVEALPEDGVTLNALTSRLVAQELQRRGLVRVSGGADLLVGYALRVERHVMAVNETGAEALLSSHHASPSYLVQASNPRIEVYDYGRLQVTMTDGARERRVWRGELWARRKGSFTRHLDGAVSRLFQELPAPPPPSSSSAHP
ncbi:MAG: DUF4136 domain-containing protein [Myxococcota bacterium]